MEYRSLLKELLFQLEEKLLKPEIRTSNDELTNLLADSFFEFGSSGKELYNNESVGEMNLGVVQMKMGDFEIHPLSEVIVYNLMTDKHSLRSSIWKLIDGRWKMHFHQGTRVTSLL